MGHEHRTSSKWVQMEASPDWGALLDRLSDCIAPEEGAAIEQASLDTGSPTYLRHLHRCVAQLLVKHGIVDWHQLRTTFPEYYSMSEAAQEVAGQVEASGSEYGGSGQAAAAASQGVNGQSESTIDHEAEKRTLASYPRIVSWWHPTKNGTNLPADYTPGSNKRVWLQCPGCPTCGEVHQWDARANDLTRRAELECPACEGRGPQVCKCWYISGNALLAAIWHENNPNPDTVRLSSRETYKWRCQEAACGYVWECQVRNRMKHPGCPECNRRRRKRKDDASQA